MKIDRKLNVLPDDDGCGGGDNIFFKKIQFNNNFYINTANRANKQTKITKQNKNKTKIKIHFKLAINM